MFQYMEPVYNTVTKTRMRFVRMVDEAFAEVADNNGVVLPDYWHITQLQKYGK